MQPRPGSVHWQIILVCLFVTTTVLSGTIASTTMVTPPLAFAATTINVTTSSDNLGDNGDCSLREAIRAANSDSAVDACPAGSGDDTIILPVGTYHTVGKLGARMTGCPTPITPTPMP